MDTPTRNETTIRESCCILRGLHGQGVSAYGPFEFMDEAIEYAEEHFPYDTWEVLTMIKEE